MPTPAAARSFGRTSTLSCALSPPTTFTCATPAIARSSPPIVWSASCVSCGGESTLDVSASDTIGSVIRIEPLDDRLENLRGELRAHGRDRVAYVLRRLVDRFRERELDDDLREAVGRRRVDLVDAADAGELVLDARDDFALDDVRRRAGIGDADEDDRLRRWSGNSSVSSRASDASPNTTSAIIVTTVMIGRLIAKSEMNMSAP